MKKITYLLLLISAYTFSQSKVYDIKVEDKKTVTTFHKFQDDSFIICATKKSNGYKGKEPNLIKLDANLEEVYKIEYVGFDNYFDFTIDGAMLNDYRYIPRSTSNLVQYHFIDKNGRITEVEKDLISGGSELYQPSIDPLYGDKRKDNYNAQFVIGNTQYSLGRKAGRENKKEEHAADDIFLYKLNLETGESKLSSAPSQELADVLSYRKAHISFLKNDDSSYSLLFRDNRERIFSDYSVLTYDLNGKLLNKVKIITDLDEGKHFRNNKIYYEKSENVYYTYGLYHEHDNANRKLTVAKFRGYFIQKFDTNGTLLWKIQKPFLTEAFKDNQSQQDCLFDLNLIANNKLLFSAGTTDEGVYDELVIDKNSGEIVSEKGIEAERSMNGYPKNMLIIERLSLADSYGKNNFFNTTGMHLLSLNDEFSNYVKQLKDNKNDLHFKATTVDGGFVVFQSDLKTNEHKLLKFNW